MRTMPAIRAMVVMAMMLASLTTALIPRTPVTTHPPRMLDTPDMRAAAPTPVTTRTQVMASMRATTRMPATASRCSATGSGYRWR